jgi:hypothetical protein
MNMTPSAMRRRALPLLLLLLLGVRAEAQRMLVPTLPAPPAAKEALFGSIAPDGRSFVYEVVEGDERLLWRLDLGSLRAERLTPAPGVRYHPVWAPDGKHLAYWRSHPIGRSINGSEGLYLLDVGVQTEGRLVSSADDAAAYAGDVTWLADGRIVYWQMLERPSFGDVNGRFTLVAMRPDGAVAHSPTSWVDRRAAKEISSTGTKVAYVAPCCGGAQQAIWIRDAAGARCVAGPIVPSAQSGRTIAWARDEKRIYLVARAKSGADTLEHAFAIDLDREEAWRIGPSSGTAASVSVSDKGDVFLTLFPAHGRVGSLWRESASNLRVPKSGAERLRHCPPLAPPITDFVSRSNLPKVRSIDPIYEDSAHRLTIFSVAFGDPCDVYSTRTGVRYGSRIGWIQTNDLCQAPLESDSIRRILPWFPLHSSDKYLFSDSLAARLENVPSAAEYWRLFLIRHPATPLDAILREVRHDPRWLAYVALQNPSVTRDTIPFDARLKLAALEDTLAAAAVGLPSVRSDPERLAQIADLPGYRSGTGLAAMRVRERMQQLMPSLVANAQTLSERAALHVYMAEEAAVNMDSLRSALLRALSPSQRRVVLALAAIRTWYLRADDVSFARATLAQLGSTPERELLDAIRRVRMDELPGSLPEFMLTDVERIPSPVLDAISRLDERFRHARARAALEMAAAPSTPDSVVGVLSEGLSRHRDPALAERLLQRRPYADTSRTLLRAVAELESIQYGRVAKQARERLATLDPPGSPNIAPHRPSPLPQSSPIAPGSLSPDSWMPTDQCLAPDDWSEQLRNAIGGDARLLAGHSLCIRAAAALNSAFELPVAYDSAYVFGVADGYVLAFPPSRPDAEVTLVRFDSAFVARSRRVVRVH